MLYCCFLWTRLRVSYAALFDPGLSGFIGILPDSTAGLLRFKCVLTLIVILIMVSALKPVYVGRGCHIGQPGWSAGHPAGPTDLSFLPLGCSLGPLVNGLCLDFCHVGFLLWWALQSI